MNTFDKTDLSLAIDVFRALLNGADYQAAALTYSATVEDIQEVQDWVVKVIVKISEVRKVPHPFTLEKYPHAWYHGKTPALIHESSLDLEDLRAEKEALLPHLEVLREGWHQEQWKLHRGMGLGTPLSLDGCVRIITEAENQFYDLQAEIARIKGHRGFPKAMSPIITNFYEARKRMETLAEGIKILKEERAALLFAGPRSECTQVVLRIAMSLGIDIPTETKEGNHRD